MLTSVAKQIYDKDILCEFGFDKLATNEFEFPILGGSGLVSGLIDGVEASIGQGEALNYIKAKDIIANQIMKLTHPTLGDKIWVQFAGPKGQIVCDLIVCGLDYPSDISIVCEDLSFVWHSTTKVLSSFYEEYDATRNTVNLYPSYLQYLTNFTISQLMELASPNTITVAQWGFLHALNQDVSSLAATVVFKAISANSLHAIGAIDGDSISATNAIAAGTSITAGTSVIAVNGFKERSRTVYAGEWINVPVAKPTLTDGLELRIYTNPSTEQSGLIVNVPPSKCKIALLGKTVFFSLYLQYTNNSAFDYISAAFKGTYIGYAPAQPITSLVANWYTDFSPYELWYPMVAFTADTAIQIRQPNAGSFGFGTNRKISVSGYYEMS